MTAPPRPGQRTRAPDDMLSLVPVSLKDANAFVAAHHRHHKPVTGHKFSIGCEQDGRLVGVAIVGRPVSRYLDNGLTLEVTRLCTTGEKNACSMLYAAAARAAKAIATAGSSPTRWTPKAGPASERRAGRVWGGQGENAGPANAVPLWTSARRR